MDKRQLVLAAFALIIMSGLTQADDTKAKLKQLDELWAQDKTPAEWEDTYRAALKEKAPDYVHLDNQCPITVQMSTGDPGIDCLIKYDMAAGICIQFYGIDGDVGIGGHNDEEGIIEGKRLYGELKPNHGQEKHGKLHGGKSARIRPAPKDVFPERVPEIPKLDRVRYANIMGKDDIAKMIKHKLIFICGGGGGMPAKQKAIMAKTMGSYYAYSHVSESGHRYFGPLNSMSPKPNNRKDAYNALRDYWKERNKVISDSSVQLNNIMATEMKGKLHRFDPEVAWRSSQIYSAMHNGLARSLGIEWSAYYAPESTSKWGPGKRPAITNTPYKGIFRNIYYYGDRPMSLIERQLYTFVLEGCDSLEVGGAMYFIFKEGPDENTFLPSDMGLKMKRLNDLAMGKTGFDRGDVYRPAAIMFDHYTNWKPGAPNDAHTWDPPGPYQREIMAIEEYKKRDYMIDNFMGAIFPDHEWGGSWGTPKGDLCNAPYGDSFEVIYDSVDTDVLAYYPSCFVLGEPEMTPEVKQKLKDYVNNGGDLVLNIMQVDEDLLAFAGVKADWHVNRWYKQLGELRVADASKNLLTGETYMEDRFHYNRVFPEKGTEVLAETAGNPEISGDLDAGWPLATKVKRGKGHVYLVMAQYMQNSSCLNFPYGMLNVCKDLIGIVLEPHQIVQIDGPPVQYIVNKQTDGGIVVTLINNDNHKAWEGKAVVKGAAKLKKVKEWYNDTVPEIATDKKNAIIETTLQPGEIQIYTFKKG